MSRLHEIAHLIEFTMWNLDVKQEDRRFLLEYVVAGFDQGGNYQARSTELYAAIYCRDCENRHGQCNEECAVYQVLNGTNE